MRKFLLYTLMMLALCKVAVAMPTQRQLNDAVNEVSAEEIVYEARWESLEPLILTARVFDNGSHRAGYAGYLCMIVGAHGITDATVKVVDVVSAENRVLGSANCRALKR